MNVKTVCEYSSATIIIFQVLFRIVRIIMGNAQ